MFSIPLSHIDGHPTADLGHWFARIRKKAGIEGTGRFETEIDRHNAIVLLSIWRHIFFGDALPDRFEQLSPKLDEKIKEARKLAEGISSSAGRRAAPTLLIERHPNEGRLGGTENAETTFQRAVDFLLEAK